MKFKCIENKNLEDVLTLSKEYTPKNPHLGSTLVSVLCDDGKYRRLSMKRFTQDLTKDTFVLPEKWCVACTKENGEELKKWRTLKSSDMASGYLMHKGFVPATPSLQGWWMPNVPSNVTLITYEQFKEHVLNIKSVVAEPVKLKVVAGDTDYPIRVLKTIPKLIKPVSVNQPTVPAKDAPVAPISKPAATTRNRVTVEPKLIPKLIGGDYYNITPEPETKLAVKPQFFKVTRIQLGILYAVVNSDSLKTTIRELTSDTLGSFALEGELTFEQVENLFDKLTTVDQRGLLEKAFPEYLKFDDRLTSVCGAIPFFPNGINFPMINTRSGGKYENKSFYLHQNYSWEIKTDEDGVQCLIPVRK